MIRKNDSLKQSLNDVRITMSTVPASWSRVSTRATVPASPSVVPPTTLVPRATALTGKTPSFAASISTPMGTPKASSTTKNHDPALPPPPSPSMSNAIKNQTNSEIDDLREKLRRSEERAQQNYDEMKEYQSWLEQAEEGQESLKDSKAPEFEPVPDNPPGLWERKDGKDASVANSDAGQDGKDWVTRISRKEHEKVTVKPWPKCQDLDVWRSNVVQAVCVASGDPDTAAWRRWLSPALLPSPDYAELADSGEFRFQSIDSKLSIALQNMVDSAGETASEVKVRIRQRSQVLGKEGNFLMGREILAMVLDHFRTTSKDEVLFNASHIYKLQYRGDKEMDKFLHAWIEIISNMKAEDIPSDNTLRDYLLRKIDGSQALHVDLTIFKGRDNDDKKKSYGELLEIMRRHIARTREDRNIAARDKFATDYTILVSLLPQLQSRRLRHLRRRMGRVENRVLQHPKVSLELLLYLPAIPIATARGKARVARDRDHLPHETLQRPFVTSTSTRAIATMVTNANIVTPNIIGTKGRTKVGKARTADRLLQGDRRPLVERRIDIAMVG